MLAGVTTALWELQARQWARITPPLRPAPEDVGMYLEVVRGWHQQRRRAPRALVLGSTPELASLRWPDGSDVIAVDRSPGMLRGVWQQAPPAAGHRHAVLGHWLALPLAPASCDLVLGDGCFAAIRRVEGPPLVRAARRVLRPDGLMMVRLYVPRDRPETADGLWSDVVNGAIVNFTAFKLRLLMALAGDDGEVCVHEAWRYVRDRAGSLDKLAAATGWERDEILAIEAYRDQPTIYWFPTLAEMRGMFAELFTELECRRPTYADGDRCPILVLAPRA